LGMVRRWGGIFVATPVSMSTTVRADPYVALLPQWIERCEHEVRRFQLFHGQDLHQRMSAVIIVMSSQYVGIHNLKKRLHCIPSAIYV